MPAKNAARVRVHDEDRFFQRVQENGISRFGADAVHGKKRGARAIDIHVSHPVKLPRLRRPTAKKSDPVFQFDGLLIEITRRPDQPRQPGARDSANFFKRQRAPAVQVQDRLFDIGPCGVLGQDGSDGYFKPLAGRQPAAPRIIDRPVGLTRSGPERRPPAPRTEMPFHGEIDPSKSSRGTHGRHGRDVARPPADCNLSVEELVSPHDPNRSGEGQIVRRSH